MPAYDVITLGETMLRLTPPGFRRIEQATGFDVEVGGSESNTAIGLARLGLRVAWLSRLTDNPLGRLIAGTLARHGVDTAHVVWTHADRVGLYFLEEGKAPRGSRVVYDRAHSAMSRMTAAELPADLFHAQGARLLHLTGITPALSADAAATAQRALELGRAAGWTISFDLNYRGQLWSPVAAQAGCDAFAQAADLLFAPLGDVRLLYALEPDASAEAALATLAARYPQAIIVLTLGDQGIIGCAPGGTTQRQPAFLAEPVGRIGGGDAFVAGFLYGYLTAQTTEERLPRSLQWGVAVAALKYSMPGDAPLVDRSEVETLLAQGAGRVALQR
jgi:2-dehydro-3-deoxygluconokinase